MKANEKFNKTVTILNKAVFKFFDKFTSDNEEVRIRSAFDLISYLNANNGDTNTKNNERSYSLKRLVRGVGSSSNASRAGFFTALVIYLEQVKDTEHCPTIVEIFQLVKSELSDSDNDADSHKSKTEVKVGKVSVCRAVILSGLIDTASDTDLELILSTLKKCMHKAVKPLAFMCLSELVKKIDTNKFKEQMWPIVEHFVNVSKDDQTMDSIYFLLSVANNHKKVISENFFEQIFATPRLLHKKNYLFFASLLMNIKHSLMINHPLYDYLIEYLVNHNKVTEFWNLGLDVVLAEENSAYKIKDIVMLRMFISILNKLQQYSCLPSLLTPTMLDTVIKKSKILPQLSEDVRDLYQEAFATLAQVYTKIEDEECKLQLFDKITSAPSTILIEKHISYKVIQKLLTAMNGNSLKKVACKLKALVLNTTNQEFLNGERICAAQTLQKLISYPQVSTEHEWRMEIVLFFLNLGLFYSSDGKTIISGNQIQSCVIAAEIAHTLRSLFFHCLEYKYTKLSEEKIFLLTIVDHVNECIKSSGNKSLRTPLNDEHMQCWHRMYKIVHKSNEKQNKLNNVFNILLMYMGINLFNDPILASSSIEELECVMKRVQNKKTYRASDKKNINESAPAEPEWIEVVIDLLLNLLSQNSFLLRKVINQLFPHLSNELTIAAFNQILSVINLKDKTNPLSATENDEESNLEAVEGDSDEDTSGVDSDGDHSEGLSESGDDEKDEFSDDDAQDNVTDKMRMAIQAALGGANPETDAESIDLDDMNEEDGKKLDEALATAFKMFKQNKKAKPSKTDEKAETVLTHFRMRVFDLIDIYLKSQPSLTICLELMLYVFEMLPIANKETKYKQILGRYRQIFNNMVKIKLNNMSTANFTHSQLTQILNDLIEKVAKGPSFPDKNQYLLKACQFIVIAAQFLEKNNIGEKAAKIDKVFAKYLKDFLAERNPALTMSVFQMLFKISWSGNWRLAKVLSEYGLRKETRSIRKTQTLQLLKELLKNKRLIEADNQGFSKTLNVTINHLMDYIHSLQEQPERSQNEFCELMQLLVELHNHQLPTVDWIKLGVVIQKLKTFNLNNHTMNHYIRFCKMLCLEPIKNNGLIPQNIDKNIEEHTFNEKDNAKNVHSELNSSNQTVKRKKKFQSAKQKRMRKEERLKAASEGLGSFSFVNVS